MQLLLTTPSYSLLFLLFGIFIYLYILRINFPFTYAWFWKATWNKAWADAGYFEAACISLREQRYEDALDELDRCLISNARNHKARALKATVLRKLGKKEEALRWIADSYEADTVS